MDADGAWLSSPSRHAGGLFRGVHRTCVSQHIGFSEQTYRLSYEKLRRTDRQSASTMLAEHPDRVFQTAKTDGHPNAATMTIQATSRAHHAAPNRCRKLPPDPRSIKNRSLERCYLIPGIPELAQEQRAQMRQRNFARSASRLHQSRVALISDVPEKRLSACVQNAWPETEAEQRQRKKIGSAGADTLKQIFF